MWRQLLGPRPRRPGRPLLRKPKAAATRTGVLEPLVSRGIKVQKVAEVLTIPGCREPQGESCGSLCPTSDRACPGPPEQWTPGRVLWCDHRCTRSSSQVQPARYCVPSSTTARSSWARRRPPFASNCQIRPPFGSCWSGSWDSGAEVDANQRSSWWMAASSAAYARTSAARSSGSSGLSGRHPSRTH